MPTLRVRGPVALAVGIGALVVAGHQVQPTGGLGRASYLGAVIGAAVLAWIAVGRYPPAQRAPWMWVAFGLTASAIGDVLYEILLYARGIAPDVSWADVAWLSSYVGLDIGLLLFLRSRRREERVDIDGLIDMAAVGTVSLLVVWQVSVEATITDLSTAPFVKAVWAAYPILDAVLLALVLRTLVSREARGWTGGLLVAGAGCWLVSDLLYLLEPFAESPWLDLGWTAGPLLIAAAAWHGATGATQDRRPDLAQVRVGAWRLAVPFVPLLAPAVIEFLAFREGEDVSPVPLAFATAVLIALAFTRSVRLLRIGERAQTRARSSERYFRALAANSADAVLVVDSEGRIRNESPAVLTMLGYGAGSTVGVDILSIVSPEDADAARAVFDESLVVPGEVFEIELRVRHADDSPMWLAARAVNLHHDPDVGGVVINLHDVTDRKQAEEELSHQAFHDSLTGLPNRALFRNRVEHALDRNARTGCDPAIIYVDLDGFKTVNDSLGHDAGDQLLREVAVRLQSAVRSGDTVARLGGDEFALLVEPNHLSSDEATAIADRVLQVLDEPVALGGRELRASASLGIAIGDGNTTADSLLRDADVAMYRAKSTGKARWVRYEPEMRTDAVERLQLETDLAVALGAGQLHLVYQPVLDLESERMVGFEALLRWDHPTLGLVVPDRFIPVAEESGLIVPIGRWVLEEACRTAARWRDRFSVDHLSMAVNVSARQLASHQLVDDVSRALTTSGLPAGALILEMTETSLVEDATVVTSRLHELRELGVRLAIDDFGTGYSSLSYLRQFPVDILKIDRSFVDTITDRDELPAIIRGLLDLSRTLELETVAEGIESEVQRDRLRRERCVLGQGYLFSRPVRAADAEALLEARHQAPAAGSAAQ